MEGYNFHSHLLAVFQDEPVSQLVVLPFVVLLYLLVRNLGHEPGLLIKIVQVQRFGEFCAFRGRYRLGGGSEEVDGGRIS